MCYICEKHISLDKQSKLEQDEQLNGEWEPLWTSLNQNSY